MTYEVLLIREDQKAGARATLRVFVQAPDPMTAKNSAEAQYPGYRAANAVAK